MSFARLFAGVASPILAERHGSPKRSFRLWRGPNWRKNGLGQLGCFRSKHYANRDAQFGEGSSTWSTIIASTEALVDSSLRPS